MRKSTIFTVLAGLYCVALVVSNVTAGKLWEGPGGFVLPAAVLLFPIVYILDDVLPEVYGLETARRVIWLGFALNAFAVAFFVLTVALPAPGFFDGSDAFARVLGFTPRLLGASFAAYLVGTNVNAWVMVRVKELTSGRLLWVRTISSTIVGEGLDSLIFITIAFFGTMPTAALGTLIVSQAVFKIAYEALATPLTYIVIGQVKSAEGVA